MTETITAREELEEILRSYHEADIQEKTAKKEKEKMKPAILALITEVVLDEVPPAKQIFKVKNDEMEIYEYDARKWVARYYPGWLLNSVKPESEHYEISIVEDPLLKKFTVEVDGYRFGRTFSVPSTQMDVEGLMKEEGYEQFAIERVEYDFDEANASQYMSDHPESKAVFEKYVVVGEPTVKLLPVTAIKEA